jgi:hypothetical protein
MQAQVQIPVSGGIWNRIRRSFSVPKQNKRNRCQNPFAWKQKREIFSLVSHRGETEKSELKRMRNETSET